MLVATCYCYLKVGVSKIYTTVKIVESVLALCLALCRYFWYSYASAAYIGFYVAWAIVVWALVHVVFNSVVIVYWEMKGVGVDIYLTKVINI